MLNREHFELLAGKPDKWDAEMLRLCDAGVSLVKAQEQQFAAGRRSAELIKTVGNGWTVMIHDWEHKGMTPGFVCAGRSYEEASSLGCQWATEDPENREFYVRKDARP